MLTKKKEFASLSANLKHENENSDSVFSFVWLAASPCAGAVQLLI
jgi:hypothetical protein